MMPSERFNRLYDNYSSTHAGRSNWKSEARLIKRDVVPNLGFGSPEAQAIVDLGCGQGGLVATLIDAGYVQAVGVDLSPEQVALAHALGVAAVHQGDYRDFLPGRAWNAIIEIDFIEHLDSEEVLELFDIVAGALSPGGVFIVRLPNNGSPFAGRYQYGDFTHKTAMTPKSFAQVARSAGFSNVECRACQPVAHGPKSIAQVGVWKVVEAAMKLALAAEAGTRREIVTQNFYGMASVA